LHAAIAICNHSALDMLHRLSRPLVSYCIVLDRL